MPLKGFKYNFHSALQDLYETDVEVNNCFTSLGRKVTPLYKKQAWHLFSKVQLLHIYSVNILSICKDAVERLVFLISPLAHAGISTAAKTLSCGGVLQAAWASASWEVRKRSTAINLFLSAPSWRGRQPTTTAG